jgi:hypothetical protein
LIVGPWSDTKPSLPRPIFPNRPPLPHGSAGVLLCADGGREAARALHRDERWKPDEDRRPLDLELAASIGVIGCNERLKFGRRGFGADRKPHQFKTPDCDLPISQLS